MTYAHAAAQEPLDAELDEWARIEDDRRELKRRDTSVDFMGSWNQIPSATIEEVC